MSRTVIVAVAIALVAVLAAGAIYEWLVPGLSSARPEPGQAETQIATWLLHRSVPSADKARVNPLANDEGEIGAGAALFQEKCEVCHRYDGSGKTQTGSGEYPRVPPLRETVASISDGEMFYHIRNGIRNTGMPAWDLPDNQIWRLVAFIRHLPQVASLAVDAEPNSQSDKIASARYVGSAACENCHRDIYARWSKSRMANVVHDPRTHPDAVIPDLSKPDPLVRFTLNDIALVYGSRWKQRYFTKVGDDYFPQPAQWDVTHRMWKPYFVPNTADWWAPLYPPDNFKRPTGPLCDGCHSVNYDIATKTVSEWNVGCEKCHGPGSAHVENPVRSTILNPARFDYVNANDTCIQCHSQGQPLRNPIEGKYYDWPVGFHVGQRLSDFWRLEGHKLGETTFTHFADGTAHKNRMQGNDFVTSLMYARGVTCVSCHDPHGNDNSGIVREKGNALCLTCHGPNAQNGPHAATIGQHTHHAAGSSGSECIACHMPKIAETIGDVKVRSHTFRFVWPAQTDELNVPNACNLCHTDKTTAWATTALKSWSDRSPWRAQ
jgi:predicted CXXCH cytochrome family protein